MISVFSDLHPTDEFTGPMENIWIFWGDFWDFRIFVIVAVIFAFLAILCHKRRSEWPSIIGQMFCLIIKS